MLLSRIATEREGLGQKTLNALKTASRYSANRHSKSAKPAQDFASGDSTQKSLKLVGLRLPAGQKQLQVFRETPVTHEKRFHWWQDQRTWALRLAKDLKRVLLKAVPSSDDRFP